MSMSAAREAAAQLAYQWQRPCWIVLDQLVRGLVLFTGPHEDYLESEPGRYWPIEIVSPLGLVENAIGR